MRGKDQNFPATIMTQGITPAYAGKSTTPVQIARGMWDHPRLCGEKTVHRNGLICGTGSPPPMRGKGYYNTFQIVDDGITPAYAGKSTWFRLALGDNEDHPRLCGEKDQEVIRTCAPYRITPAYAGKSMSFQKLPCLYQDHPRLCGEKHLAYTPMQRHRGSPPPMRGKVLLWREG